jgi:hypothetical protein
MEKSRPMSSSSQNRFRKEIPEELTEAEMELAPEDDRMRLGLSPASSPSNEEPV